MSDQFARATMKLNVNKWNVSRETQVLNGLQFRLPVVLWTIDSIVKKGCYIDYA